MKIRTPEIYVILAMLGLLVLAIVTPGMLKRSADARAYGDEGRHDVRTFKYHYYLPVVFFRKTGITQQPVLVISDDITFRYTDWRKKFGKSVYSFVPDEVPPIGKQVSIPSWIDPDGKLYGNTGRYEVLKRQDGRLYIKTTQIGSESHLPQQFGWYMASKDSIQPLYFKNIPREGGFIQAERGCIMLYTLYLLVFAVLSNLLRRMRFERRLNTD